jgi:hypothetical protein
MNQQVKHLSIASLAVVALVGLTADSQAYQVYCLVLCIGYTCSRKKGQD